MVEILFNSYAGLNILINDNSQAVIITDDFEILKRLDLEEYRAPSSEELFKVVNDTAKKYYHLDEEANQYKNINIMLYNQFLEQFKKCDFFKEYQERF